MKRFQHSGYRGTQFRSGRHFESVLVELLYGTGGNDAKAFVVDLAEMYLGFCGRHGFQVVKLTEDDGHVVLQVSGNGVQEHLQHESGKHVVQRIPPDDRKAGKQTSVVTVAVLPLPPEETLVPLRPQDIEVITQTGKQSAGGQNVNKVASAVRMKHLPTGLSVFINGRDQGQNRKDALRILTTRVNERHNAKVRSDYNSLRQVLADGSRSEKRRTYNYLQNRVHDHRLGTKTTQVSRIMRGELELLQGSE